MTIDTLSLNVIGSLTKFILHVIVLQSSLIMQCSSSVWDIPEHEAPANYSLSTLAIMTLLTDSGITRLASYFISFTKGFEHITKHYNAE